MIFSRLRNSFLLFFVVCPLWGREVPDPYRWLEEANAPRVQEWVQEQNQKTEAYLAKIPKDQKLETRLHELYYVDSVSLPQQGGRKLFYQRTFANREEPQFFWRSVDAASSTEHCWLDSSEIEGHAHATVGDWLPAPDGGHVTYTVHPEGADEAILHVREMASGRESDRDRIPGADFADISWTPDGRGFYYLRLPSDGTIPKAERVAKADIRFHPLGRDSAKDLLIFPPTQDASTYLSPQVSEDGQWIFVTAAKGWASDDIYYSDRPSGPRAHFMPLFISTAATADVEAWKSYFYLHTNQDAPHGKVLRKKPLEKGWEMAIPERSDVMIESMRLVGGYIVLVVLKNAANQVEVYKPEGQLVWQIPLPGQGSVWDISGRENQADLYIDYESFFVPPSILHAHLAARRLEVWEEPNHLVDASRYRTDLVWYPSKDGTKISMMIVQPRDLVRNGKAPVLLEGYGGFNVSMLPSFSQEAVAWLEKGGIFAIPHLRGGGEYGEAWHQAGMLTHKQNTFDDFIAAAEFLVKEGYTRPDHLAIQGISNGGLLVAAAMTQRPDLFGAVVCKNPLTDMIRYPLFGEGKAWVPEYGSPDKKDEFEALMAYSPYHHVSAAAYPSLLMFAGEHDDRVDPLHARKFTAALQAVNVSGRPILFRLLPHSGHAGADQLKAKVQETKERLSFLFHELGMPQ